MNQFSYQYLGKFLVIFGAVVILLGMILMLGGKIPLLGKLPGDINIKKENFSFHFPIVTSILLSVILTAIINLVFRK